MGRAAEQNPLKMTYRFDELIVVTFQGTKISHPGKRKIIDSKVPTGKEYVSFQEGNPDCWQIQRKQTMLILRKIVG